MVPAMLSKQIVEAVRSVIGKGPQALHEPLFIGNEQKYVADSISSGWVAHGEYIQRFEQMLCDFTGAKYAVATCNATCALEAVFRESGVDDVGAVNIPSLTFAATANALVHAGGKPRFSEDKLGAYVYLLGHYHHHDFPALVVDAAQALGTESPRWVDVPYCYSFNGNKIITTGGGGAVVTDDVQLANWVRRYISTARVPHAYRVEHEQVAFNYRMPNLNAALGCAQMEQLPFILKAKRALAHKYIEAFGAIDGVTVWKEPEGTKSNYWLVAIILDDPAEQEPAIQALHAAGYMARLLPTPLHMLPMYKDCPRGDMTRTEDLWRRTICLPSSPKLGIQYA